jgi:hypothetical protein
VSTSFWFNNWTSISPLANTLPVVFSISLAPDATVAAWPTAPSPSLGANGCQPASAEFSLVEGALGGFAPTLNSDMQVVIGGSMRGFKAADAYRLVHSTGCGPLYMTSNGSILPQ